MAAKEEEFLDFHDKTHNSELMKALSRQKQNGEYCDVFVQVSGQLLSAHSCVLAAGSPYFSEVLATQPPREFSEKFPQTINMCMVDGEWDAEYAKVVAELVNFLYTGKIHVEKALTEKVQSMAQIMQLNKVSNFCREVLSERKENLNEELENNEIRLDVEKKKRGRRRKSESQTQHSEVNVESPQPTRRSARISLRGLRKRKASSPSKSNQNAKSEKNNEWESESDKESKVDQENLKRKTKKLSSFQCDECSYSTKRLKQLHEHKCEHKLAKNMCNYCDKQFSEKAELDTHLEKHQGELPYFCTSCPMKFKTKSKWKGHNLRHSDSKPFVCSLCNAAFKWKHALKAHQVIHTDKREHLCDFCGWATAHKSMLRAHRLIHTDQMFRCEIEGCSFQCTRKMNIKYHMLTHTGEKPHQCELCGTAFSMQKNLRRHMLLHQAKKPYQCTLCDYTTARQDKLREHKNKQHQIGEAPKKRVSLQEKYCIVPPPDDIVSQKNLTLPLTNTQLVEEIVASEGAESGQNSDPKASIQGLYSHITKMLIPVSGQQVQLKPADQVVSPITNTSQVIRLFRIVDRQSLDQTLPEVDEASGALQQPDELGESVVITAETPGEQEWNQELQ